MFPILKANQMKSTYYFSHDYNARFDTKIRRLILRHGMAGYGIFWAIIEDLYNNANALHLDCESIAFELRTDISIVKSVINDFDLFQIDGETFGSLSVERRLNERSNKSEKAAKSANARWEKHKQDKYLDANALRPQSEGNAGKEKKGKKIKENKIEERKLKFASTLEPFLQTYGKQMLNDFYKYWTEPNKSNSKFKMELENTWSLERRLETWANNDSRFNKNKPTEQGQVLNSLQESINNRFKNGR